MLENQEIFNTEEVTKLHELATYFYCHPLNAKMYENIIKLIQSKEELHKINKDNPELTQFLDDLNKEISLLNSIADNYPKLYSGNIVMYSLIRVDIHMNAGKAIAQAGHAYASTLLKAQQTHPETVFEYHNNQAGIGTKIALKATSEEDIKQVKAKLDELNIPNHLVVDSEHVFPPHFDGSPVVTALGIGPVDKSEVFTLLSNYHLY